VGEASAAKQDGDRRDGDRRARIAAQRVADQRTRARNRVLLAAGAIIVVVAVVLALVLFHGSGSPTPAAGEAIKAPAGTSLTQLIRQVTSVPTATLDQVGAGQTSANPSSISGSALTANGKPEMLYMGAEFCPYCGAERWSMINALSRFGTFTGLATIRSAARDGGGSAEPYPSTPTWTFAKATYSSPYLTFTPVEMNTNIPDKATGGYTTLQTPTAAQQALIDKYDAAYQGAIPFIDYGNKYLSVGASYDPGVLHGLAWAQIATDLHNQASPVARAVLGTANYMTAAICDLTSDQPASACTATVTALQAKI
jgi:hypothetical protein